MKRAFLENVWAGYEVMQWAALNSARIIRCIPKRKGCVVYFIGSTS